MVTLDDEPNPRTGSWQPLLKKVMQDGEIVEGPNGSDRKRDLSALNSRDVRFAALNHARERAQDQQRHLPEELLALDFEAAYRVEFSERIATEKDKLERQIIEKQELQE
jgi:hypothetical protein